MHWHITGEDYGRTANQGRVLSATEVFYYRPSFCQLVLVDTLTLFIQQVEDMLYAEKLTACVFGQHEPSARCVTCHSPIEDGTLCAPCAG